MRMLSIIAVIAALAVSHIRADEPFPAHTVKLVVPGASGSTTDIIARLMADQLRQKWGKPVVVEKWRRKPGWHDVRVSLATRRLHAAGQPARADHFQ